MDTNENYQMLFFQNIYFAHYPKDLLSQKKMF